MGRMTKGGLRFLGEGRREGFYSNFIVLSVLKNKRIRKVKGEMLFDYGIMRVGWVVVLWEWLIDQNCCC